MNLLDSTTKANKTDCFHRKTSEMWTYIKVNFLHDDQIVMNVEESITTFIPGIQGVRM